MKGRIYQVDDFGRGGRDGYVHVITRLCVDGQVHLTHQKLDNGAEFLRPVPCDGSCNEQMELDESAEALVMPLLRN